MQLFENDFHGNVLVLGQQGQGLAGGAHFDLVDEPIVDFFALRNDRGDHQGGRLLKMNGAVFRSGGVSFFVWELLVLSDVAALIT